MRQLGGRLPEPPPVMTEEETPPVAEQRQSRPASLEPHEAQQPQAFPVEVHRIEHRVIDSGPPQPPLPPAAAQPSRVQAEIAPAAAEPAKVPTGQDEVPPPLQTSQAEVPPAPVKLPSAQMEVPPAQADLVPPQGEAPSAEADVPPPAVDPVEPSLPRVAGTQEKPPALRITEAKAPAPVEPAVSSGRWEEFGEFRRLEPGRGGHISLESMQQPPMPLMPSRGLLAADREPEHRSSFMTIAVPGLAAILAIGALVWSGSLRDRLRQQGSEMSALQQQNRKLADTLATMHQDEKASGLLNPEPASPTLPAEQSATNPPTSAAQPQAHDNVQAPPVANAAPPPSVPARTATREGVSTPPPVRASVPQRGSRGSVDPNYHPEIVPPYPTLSKPGSVAAAPTPSQAPSAQQSYHEPFTVNPSASSGRSSATPVPQTPPSTVLTRPAASTSAASSPGYTAMPGGVYASALAQNIEAVQALQRQSTIPLREFHGHDGAPVTVTPGLSVSVRSPDQARGTYALLVNAGSAGDQLRGYVNRPLAFNDSTTHRGYELVVLSIAGGEVYGYVRPTQ